MKIFAIADIHCNVDLLIQDWSDIDLILIAGDLTHVGRVNEYIHVFEWLYGISEKYLIPVVYTLGNHDGKRNHNIVLNRFTKYKNFICLDNEIIDIKGLKIYGSPYTCYIGWYNHYRTLDECQDLTLPKEPVDIILSHEPPDIKELSYGYACNNELLKYLHEHTGIIGIFGHIHECGGNIVEINGNTCYNVAKKPKIIELEIA